MIQAMREAKSGVYCGPLRLLAMEVFDSVNQQVASRLCTTRSCMHLFHYNSAALAHTMQAAILLHTVVAVLLSEVFAHISCLSFIS